MNTLTKMVTFNTIRYNKRHM